MVNIAVLTSGGGTNLEAILNAEERGDIKSGNVQIVIADRAGCYSLVRAENHKKKNLLLNRKELGRKEFEKRLVETLICEKIDLIVLAGFLSILSEDFTEFYRDRIINIHPSLIPSFSGEGYYGLKVHEAALKRGVKLTGATVHLVNEIPDGGKILFQKAVEVKDGDTPEALQKRVMEEAEWIILPMAVEYMADKIDKERV